MRKIYQAPTTEVVVMEASQDILTLSSVEIGESVTTAEYAETKSNSCEIDW